MYYRLLAFAALWLTPPLQAQISDIEPPNTLSEISELLVPIMARDVELVSYRAHGGHGNATAIATYRYGSRLMSNDLCEIYALEIYLFRSRYLRGRDGVTEPLDPNFPGSYFHVDSLSDKRFYVVLNEPIDGFTVFQDQCPSKVDADEFFTADDREAAAQAVELLPEIQRRLREEPEGLTIDCQPTDLDCESEMRSLSFGSNVSARRRCPPDAENCLRIVFEPKDERFRWGVGMLIHNPDEIRSAPDQPLRIIVSAAHPPPPS